MKKTTVLAVPFFAATLLAGITTAFADNAEAMCEVRKDGDTKKGASGPCDFSQRQGYIDIDLRNGDKYSLSPTDKPDHFKDQKKNKVVRKSATATSQEFRWEGGKKIIVTFVASGT